MKPSIRTLGVGALLFVLFGLSFLQADTKLRVYLKDGTLRAGNLVKETDKSFVLVTQDGRVEVEKQTIMFINGKTLRQWEAEPEKNFQTEIMPSEVPDPAYVNNRGRSRTPINPYSSIQGNIPQGGQVEPEPEPEPEPKFEKPEKMELPEFPLLDLAKVNPKAVEKKAAKKPVSPPSTKSVAAESPVPEPPVQPAVPSGGAGIRKSLFPPTQSTTKPKPVVKKTAAKKPVVAVVPQKKKAPKKAVKKKPAKKKTVVKKSKPRKAKVAKKRKARKWKPRRPSGFNRKRLANYHYEKAMAQIKKGETGRAIQNLHYSRTLNRKPTETSMKLAKIYMEQGVFKRARKYFKHPKLRKTDEVKGYVVEMEEAEKKAELEPYILGASGFFGFLFGSIGLIWAKRKITTARRTKVIVADDIVPTPLPALDEKPEPAPAAKEEGPPTVPEPAPAPKVPEPVASAAGPSVPETPKPEEPKPEEAKPQVPTVPPALQPEPVAAKPEPKVPAPPAEPAKAPPAHVPPVPPAQVPPPKAPPPMEVIHPEPVPEPVAEAPAPASIPAPVPEPVKYTPHPLITNHREIVERAKMVSLSIDRGNQFCTEGRVEDARREYRTAMALDPNYDQAYVGLGFLSYMQGQWELAMEYYLRALKLNPNSADAHYGVGRILVDTGQGDDAAVELQRALELDPQFDDARDTLTYLGKAA